MLFSAAFCFLNFIIVDSFECGIFVCINKKREREGKEREGGGGKRRGGREEGREGRTS